MKEISAKFKEQYDVLEDMDFITKARLANGYTVYHRPCW